MARLRVAVAAALAGLSAVVTTASALGYSLRDLLPKGETPQGLAVGPNSELLVGLAVFFGSMVYIVYERQSETDSLKRQLNAATPHIVFGRPGSS